MGEEGEERGKGGRGRVSSGYSPRSNPPVIGFPHTAGDIAYVSREKEEEAGGANLTNRHQPTPTDSPLGVIGRNEPVSSRIAQGICCPKLSPNLKVPTIINGSISAHLVVVSIAKDVILVDFDEQRVAVRFDDLCETGGGGGGGPLLLHTFTAPSLALGASALTSSPAVLR